MTSKDVTVALLDRLDYVGRVDDRAIVPGAFTFELDFESSRIWPDLPFDTASPQSRYELDARPLILQTLEEARRLFRDRAPKAWAFVNAELDRAMIRRSDTINGASSSSNRELVGTCLLTNLHAAPDRVFICLEGLVHEAIHQCLYRMEQASGDFCDLGDTGRYRSPWSGNRIPLHSLIHASFVWFGLLSFWLQLARAESDRAEPLDLRGRVAPTLFGFAFIRDLTESPRIPRTSVDPRIAELIGHISGIADCVGPLDDAGRKVRDSLQGSEAGAWVADLCSGLERIKASWTASAALQSSPTGARSAVE